MDHNLRDEDLQLYELFDEHWSRLAKILPTSKKLSSLEEVRIGIEEQIEDIIERGEKKSYQDFIDGRRDVIPRAWLADTLLKKQSSDLDRMKRLGGKSIAFEIDVSWIVGSSVDNQQHLRVVFRIEDSRKVYVARRTVTLREYGRTVGEMTSSDDSEAAWDHYPHYARVDRTGQVAQFAGNLYGTSTSMSDKNHTTLGWGWWHWTRGRRKVRRGSRRSRRTFSVKENIKRAFDDKAMQVENASDNGTYTYSVDEPTITSIENTKRKQNIHIVYAFSKGSHYMPAESVLPGDAKVRFNASECVKSTPSTHQYCTALHHNTNMLTHTKRKKKSKP